ncbi:hypothetical protein F5Y10DRAFT_262375 [Nemania abortiva]|nr:hypothetical protein F5Y10DRAFT_262375 [Nemania abortiva]
MPFSQIPGSSSVIPPVDQLIAAIAVSVVILRAIRSGRWRHRLRATAAEPNPAHELDATTNAIHELDATINAVFELDATTNAIHELPATENAIDEPATTSRTADAVADRPSASTPRNDRPSTPTETDDDFVLLPDIEDGYEIVERPNTP